MAENTLSTKIAHIVSYAFHPGIMPTLLLAILYIFTPFLAGFDGYSLNARWLTLGFIFIYTFLFPLLFTYWLYRKNYINSFKLENRKDRYLPYLITILSSLVLSYLLFTKNSIFAVSTYYLWLFILVVIVVLIINFWWQISAHSAGVGGVVGILFMLRVFFQEPLLTYPLFTSIILAGIIIWARLKLNAHTEAQVYIGFLSGFMVCSIGTLFL